MENFIIPTNIYLIGMPGSGKSTLGAQLSTELEVDFYDLDQEIELSAGKSIQKIFSEEGEDGFRTKEKECLINLSKLSHSKVIATGGGTPCFHHNMDLINRHGVSIFLDVPLEVVVKRLIAQGTGSRPLLRDKLPQELLGQLHEHFQLRKPHYLQSEIHLEGIAISVKEIIEELKAL